jgi:hypothetical protein
MVMFVCGRSLCVLMAAKGGFGVFISNAAEVIKPPASWTKLFEHQA